MDSDQEETHKFTNSAKLEVPEPGEGQEYQEKLTIILSIKVTEMMKKIKILLDGIANEL